MAEVRFLLLSCLLAYEQTWPTGNSPHTPSIHILDDDSLLHIFYLYRPTIFDGDEDNILHFAGGRRWDRERWWYQLAHVCQGWRNLILRSASFLGLCLVCTYGTSIADMLAHSHPLPLIIDFNDAYRKIAAEDEDEIILALEQRERVHRIRIISPLPNMQRFITAIEGEYPILEYLIMATPYEDRSAGLMVTETLQAPHLRHLTLRGFGIPVESRLLTTAVGLVALALGMNHPSTYLQPNTLLRWISFMPQLDMLRVHFEFPVPSRDVERQLMRTPITTHVTLPNLLELTFGGGSAYMEAVVQHITPPRLEKLLIVFPNQLTFSIPRLLEFINTTENLRFSHARFQFSDEEVFFEVYPHEEAKTYSFGIAVNCWDLDWQVSSVAQMSNALSQKFSTVEHLTLEHEVHSRSSEEHNEVNDTEWRKLLGSFSNVRTLRIPGRLVRELSRCIRLDDGEHPLELFPELQELIFSGSSAVGDAFTEFIDARKSIGRPVTLTCG